jgi:peptide/nickel transport system substrate-binding protein
VWRYTLRGGVTFHEGQPFTADDVVFSYNRARGEGSDMRSLFASVAEVRKLDEFTVELVTALPDPILPDKLAIVGIMSRAWAEAHDAMHPADLNKKEENYATRHADGTGPFKLGSREPDVKTVLEVNPGWWDTKQHNLNEVQFYRIANPATRVAALLTGEVDFIYTVPPADEGRLEGDPNLKVLTKPELRVIFLGMDQYRDELLGSSIKGKNPFKDLRVRQALLRAIDVDAIHRTVMRGQSTPTALMVAHGIHGRADDLDVRPGYDPEAARGLLAEAGYPNGFEISMDCPNDRYVNDEAICKAVVSMLAKVGVKVDLLAQTRAKYFAKILSLDTSFYMLGWTPPDYYVLNTYQNAMATRDEAKALGQYNIGRWSNREFDDLLDKIALETDSGKRDAYVREATRIHLDQVGHIPLHQQALVWAMRKNIDVVQQADNFFPLRYVIVQ